MKQDAPPPHQINLGKDRRAEPTQVEKLLFQIILCLVTSSFLVPISFFSIHHPCLTFLKLIKLDNTGFKLVVSILHTLPSYLVLTIFESFIVVRCKSREINEPLFFLTKIISIFSSNNETRVERTRSFCLATSQCKAYHLQRLLPFPAPS